MGIDFKAKQQEFAAFIREPRHNPAPADVSAERMDMYRQLFFNNIDSFLSSTFPVLRKLLDDQRWEALAQDFFAQHPCHTPYFSEIPEEFLSYLENGRNNPDDFPFMLELAHYEWVEMALDIAKDELPIQAGQAGDLSDKTISLSPLAWPLAYQYPVQKISPDFLPTQVPTQPTFMVVYRDQNDDVRFLEITPITYRLLEIIQEQEQGILASTALSQLAAGLPHTDPQAIIKNGLDILQELVKKSVVFWAD